MPQRNTSPTEQDLQVYLEILPNDLFDGDELSLEITAIQGVPRKTFARLLFNLHQGLSAWRGVAPHDTATRFKHIAECLARFDLIQFDQHRMRWELCPHIEEKLPCLS